MLSLPHLWYERYFYFRRKKRLRLTSIYVHRIYQNMSRVAVVIVICCLGLSERHGFFQLSICSVCQKVLYVFRFSSWMRTICPFYDEVIQSEKSLAIRKW